VLCRPQSTYPISVFSVLLSTTLLAVCSTSLLLTGRCRVPVSTPPSASESEPQSRTVLQTSLDDMLCCVQGFVIVYKNHVERRSLFSILSVFSIIVSSTHSMSLVSSTLLKFNYKFSD